MCAHRKKQKIPELQYGPSVAALPRKAIKPWRGEVAAAYTGPNAGFTRLNISDTSTVPDETLDQTWNSPREYAYGISLSLYEEDRRKARAIRTQGLSSASTYIMGEPVADVFGIVVRENCCVMATADGVNWGKKSRLAARCATYAVMEHFSQNMHLMTGNPTSATITRLLHESVTEKAQKLILEKEATLTTLSTAVVCETQTPGEWGLFVCAVGDSPVYIYCPHTRQVVEATVGCHGGDGSRDARMAGGALGPSCGPTPDLGNLTFAYMPVYPGDIVFAVTDGVSDNLSDKVMGASADDKAELKSCCNAIPHLTKLLSEHQDDLSENLSAQTLTARLINHAVEVTDKKRSLMGWCTENNVDMRRERDRNPEFAGKLKAATGKLDHATVVAYQVGRHLPKPDRY